MNLDEQTHQSRTTGQLFHNSAATTFPNWPIHIKMLGTFAAAQLLEHRPRLARWLNDEEQQRLASFSLPKRRKEWLAGRLCAKVVAAHYLQLPNPVRYNEITIANSKSGRPFLRLTREFVNPSLPDISISHSGDFAIAGCAGGYCGIDIQEQKDSLHKVIERYCTTYEMLLLKRILAPLTFYQRLNLLWTAKEAIRKTISRHYIPGFMDIQLQKITPNQAQTAFTLIFSIKSGTIKTVSQLFPNYAISLSLLE